VESYYNYGVLLLTVQKFEQAENAFRKASKSILFTLRHNTSGTSWSGRASWWKPQRVPQGCRQQTNDRQAHFNLAACWSINMPTVKESRN